MLWSRDPATVDTALELVKAEGIAEGTITALFVVAKLHPDDKLRAPRAHAPQAPRLQGRPGRDRRPRQARL
jgi:hypothetical protein